jgi:methionyl aminopeptidase
MGMGTLKTAQQIATMKEGGTVLAAILRELAATAKPGMQTRDLSAIAAQRIKDNGMKASFLGQRMSSGEAYPDVICLSVNDQCVHTPGGEYALKEGDLLKLDFGILHEGLHSDAATTVLVTNLDKDAVKEKLEYKDRRKLIAVTRECLERALKLCEDSHTLGDIGFAVQQHAEKNGFSVAKELGGHGIGRELHEEPWVANFGRAHAGPRLEIGMVIAIEPIINMGGGAIRDGKDGMTYETSDGSLSAHFEHTVAITEKGPEILTV